MILESRQLARSCNGMALDELPWPLKARSSFKLLKIQQLKWYNRQTKTSVSADATTTLWNLSTVTAWFTWNIILSSASSCSHFSTDAYCIVPLDTCRQTHVVKSLLMWTSEIYWLRANVERVFGLTIIYIKAGSLQKFKNNYIDHQTIVVFSISYTPWFTNLSRLISLEI